MSIGCTVALVGYLIFGRKRKTRLGSNPSIPPEAVEGLEKPLTSASPMQPVNVAGSVVPVVVSVPSCPIVVYVPESLFKGALASHGTESKAEDREPQPQQAGRTLIWREGEKP